MSGVLWEVAGGGVNIVLGVVFLVEVIVFVGCVVELILAGWFKW